MPPEATDEALERIVTAEDVKDLENYFIPIITSEVRDEKDKGKYMHTQNGSSFWLYLV